MTAGDPAPLAGRLVALDVFRGATVASMILVNNPGSWQHVYPPLRHADWHGWTPTDLVFPFFLFIVGVAIPLAFARRQERGAERGEILGTALRRAAVLCALGLFLNAFPFVQDFAAWEWRDFGRLRFPGVLQRIAVCYAVAAALCLYLRPRARLAVQLGCLFGYWALMTLVPVPGHGAGAIDGKDTHLAACIDRAVFGDHLWAAAKTWDPEGLLSTVPALATTLFGVSAGRLLLASGDRPAQVRALLVRGALLVVAGYAWGLLFPINKALWTSSYAVFTAGLALGALGLCIWVVDVRGQRRWTRPLVAYGVNAITVFVASGVIGRVLGTARVGLEGGGSVSLKGWLYERLFASWIAPPELASLGFAFTWVGGWAVVLAFMLRRGWILRV